MSNGRWRRRAALARSSRRRLALLACLVLLGASTMESWGARDAFAAGESGSTAANTPPTGGDGSAGSTGGQMQPNAQGGNAQGGNAQGGTDQSDAYTVTKSVAGDAIPGHTLTYTVKVQVTADVASAGFTDDLRDQVLDDATYSGDASATSDLHNPDAASSIDDTTKPGVISWTGSLLETGDEITVTYSVQVDDPDTGDGIMINGVRVDQGGQCGTCFVTSAVRGDFTVRASSSPAAGSTLRVGDTVRYTIVVTGGHATANPAGVVDTIPASLDYAGDARASLGNVSVDGRKLTWNSALKPGERATITFSGTVAGDAAGRGLTNSVTPVSSAHTTGSCETASGCSISVHVAAAAGRTAPAPPSSPAPTQATPPPSTHPAPSGQQAGIDPASTSVPAVANTGVRTAALGSLGLALLAAGTLVLAAATRWRSRARHTR